jgi:HEPN domain-containing protein
MPDEAVVKEVKAWIAKAENDFRNIELVLPAKDAPFDTVCFHAEQAAEKYIKSLLTYHGIAFGKIHDLPELLLLLPETSRVPSKVGDLSELADAAIMSRYPGDPDEYNRTIAERLVSQAKNVKTAVLAELKLKGMLRSDR